MVDVSRDYSRNPTPTHLSGGSRASGRPTSTCSRPSPFCTCEFCCFSFEVSCLAERCRPKVTNASRSICFDRFDICQKKFAGVKLKVKKVEKARRKVGRPSRCRARPRLLRSPQLSQGTLQIASSQSRLRGEKGELRMRNLKLPEAQGSNRGCRHHPVRVVVVVAPANHHLGTVAVVFLSSPTTFSSSFSQSWTQSASYRYTILF